VLRWISHTGSAIRLVRALRAKRNALALERFARAGANVFGKSNVPTLLADWETNNPVYGKTVNPWDASRSRRRRRCGGRASPVCATSPAPRCP